jgi:Spy/CpxP family protein refolding chaperone
MKNLILTAVIVFAFIAGVNAQSRFSSKDRLQQMKDSLALSDSQAAVIDSLFTGAGEKIKNIDLTGQDRRDAIRKIMDEVNTQVETVLTPDQKTKYEQMLANQRSRMQNRQRDSNRPLNNGN